MENLLTHECRNSAFCLYYYLYDQTIIAGSYYFFKITLLFEHEIGLTFDRKIVFITHTKFINQFASVWKWVHKTE